MPSVDSGGGYGMAIGQGVPQTGAGRIAPSQAERTCHQCLYIAPDTIVCTTCTNIGVMPTSGHETNVCAALKTKVCVVWVGFTHTLLAVGSQSVCAPN